MPAILERLVSQLEAKGYSQSSAFAIGTSALQKSGNLKPGTREETIQGSRQGQRTPADRAKARAAKRSGRSPIDYRYNTKTNRATLG